MKYKDLDKLCTLCDCCGKRIYYGERVYHDYNGCVGVYCSPECFASAFAEQDDLSIEFARNQGIDLYREREDNNENDK